MVTPSFEKSFEESYLWLWSMIKIPKTQIKTKEISNRVRHLSKYGKKPRTRKKNLSRIAKNSWF